MTPYQVSVLRRALGGETFDEPGDGPHAHEMAELVASGYVFAGRTDHGGAFPDYYVTGASIKGREALEAPGRERAIRIETHVISVALAVLSAFVGAYTGVRFAKSAKPCECRERGPEQSNADGRPDRPCNDLTNNVPPVNVDLH